MRLDGGTVHTGRRVHPVYTRERVPGGYTRWVYQEGYLGGGIPSPTVKRVSGRHYLSANSETGDSGGQGPLLPPFLAKRVKNDSMLDYWPTVKRE